LHTFLIILAVVICVAAVVLVVCHFNDDNMTPVGKTAGSVFIAAVALVVSLQVMLDYPDQSDYLAPRLVSATSAEQYAGQVERRQSVAPVELPAQVVEAPRPAAVPGVAPSVAPGVTSVAAAPVVVQAPREDSTFKDMALGGALGYLAGSAGRGSDVRSVTNHTTVIHSEPAPSYTAPAPVSPRPTPSSVVASTAAPRPAPAPVVAPPRQTFKSTFSMTRSRR
jgi:hypothetical protein